MKKCKLRWAATPEGVDCYIKVNKRFYGFVQVAKVNNPNPGFERMYWLKVLIPGGSWDWNLSPINGKKAAKAQAVLVAQAIINDLQGIVLF